MFLRLKIKLCFLSYFDFSSNDYSVYPFTWPCMIFFRWSFCDSQKQANILYVYKLWYIPLTIYCREYQIPLTIGIKLVCDTSMDFDWFIDWLIYCCGYQIKMTVRRNLICDISMHFDSFINRIFYRCEYHIKVTVKKSLYAIRKYTFTIHLPMKRLSLTSLWIKSRWMFSFFPNNAILH